MPPECRRSGALCDGAGQGLSARSQMAPTSRSRLPAKLGGRFPQAPRETVSSMTVCSYSHSLWIFAAPRASSSELCARHLPLQRSSLPTQEVTRGTALAQEWPSKPGQGGDFFWQNRRLPHLDGGPPRNGGQPLFPRRRDRGKLLPLSSQSCTCCGIWA